MHYLAQTAKAANDDNLARRVRIDEVMEGWTLPCTVYDILASDDIDIATDETHPVLGALGSMPLDEAQQLVMGRLDAMSFLA